MLKARYVLTASIKPLTATNFTCFTKTKATWFSINFGKHVTRGQNFDDSSRNIATDFPCGLQSKTADIHSSINHPSYSSPAQLCLVEKLFIQNTEAEIWSITPTENQALQYLPSQIASWASSLSLRHSNAPQAVPVLV